MRIDIREKRAKARFSRGKTPRAAEIQKPEVRGILEMLLCGKTVKHRWTTLNNAPFLFFMNSERSVILIATIGIRLLPEEKELLAAIARRTDTTISQILRKMIRDYINSHGELAVEKENVYESI